jgi:hypothetical protein
VNCNPNCKRVRVLASAGGLGWDQMPKPFVTGAHVAVYRVTGARALWGRYQ